MTSAERHAQLVAVSGRIVRTSVSASKYIAVMECSSAASLNRTKNKLTALGWTVVKTSGLSVQLEVKL